MNTSEYGYGHTKEAVTLVREALKQGLQRDIKPFGLKISVRKADSSYGGPRVEITTNLIALDKRYEYIVNSDGSGIGDGPGKLKQARGEFKVWTPSPLSKTSNARDHRKAKQPH